MPILDGVATGLGDKISFVKEQAKNEGFRLIDSSDSGEVLGFMKDKASGALL
jgi:hypothetical protein